MQTKDKLMKINMETVDEELETLRDSLRSMHQEVVDRKEKTRLYQKMAKEGKLENFSVGDYVLWSRVDERLRGNKLMVRWVGPYRVTTANEYSFTIEHLLTGDSFEVHGSRLKYYDDASMDVDEEVLEHVAKQGIVLGVACFRDHRYNTTTNQWELLVSWRGLQNIEDSWEPLQAMQRDVPNLVANYAEHQADEVFHAQLDEA
ncbi:hypothetical protein P3T76_010346 [Phytophthora citrophthora]|uniref:Chromo domain-containing protein n=1 Tax=Phytophthora citrophthora TaxID=4793 RepID=A0AAD9GBW3_9STRA|nr:hypothetical protein P3T76_010346 [Phytophthora citrophthora]